VVDDDPWILRMVTATLQKKDFVVDTAREGRQALERAQANPPDVIISDVMMPVMDGWAFVQRLRGIPRLASIPVIFLTALGKDEAKLRSLGMGPEDFLPKPFRFEELEKRVTAALKAAPAGGATGPAPGTNPGVNPQSGAHPVPNPQSGAHPMPNPQSGVHPMPGPPNAPPQGAPPAGYPGYPPGYPYGPGYPGAPPPAGYGPQPGYPGYAPPYASGYPGQNPYAPPAQPGGPFAPYPNANQPSKTPVRGPGEAAPEPPPAAEPPAQSQAPQQPPQSGLTEPSAQPPAQPPAQPAAQAPAKPPEPEATEPAAAQSATSRRLPSGDRLPAIAPGTPGSRRTTALNGRLEQLGLSSLLVMMEMERKDGVLSLRDSDTGMVGRIFLRGGQVISAKLDEKPDQDGKQCVYTMLAWKAGTFSFSATRVDMEDTINSSTTHLLMEGARLIDEAARGGSDDLDGDFL